jgi:hypothetical protein
MKHKTALRMHIDWMENQLKECSPMAPAIPFLTMAIQKAKSLIQKEKAQIIKANRLGRCKDCPFMYTAENAEKYYNKTYGTE